MSAESISLAEILETAELAGYKLPVEAWSCWRWPGGKKPPFHTALTTAVDAAEQFATAPGNFKGLALHLPDYQPFLFIGGNLNRLQPKTETLQDLRARLVTLGAQERKPLAEPGLTGPADWPEPLPLGLQLAPEPYPLDALPETVRLAVQEVAGFVQAPIPLVAGCALSALSLAIQAQIDVERAQGLAGPVGLFLLTIADSGERKSTCDGFFQHAIREWENEEADKAVPLLQDYAANLEAWESRRSGIKEAIKRLAKNGKETRLLEQDLREHERAKPQRPRVPRLTYVDSTPEALAFALARGWPAAGVISAEAGLVLGAHGMGSDSIMRNLSMLNQLWDGSSLHIDRRTSESFTVRGARLTVALQIQGPTLLAFFEKAGALARGTGFLSRFLVAWPDSTQGTRKFTEPPASWPALSAFSRRIGTLLRQPVAIDDSGALSPSMVHLTAEARRTWVMFHDGIEEELGDGGALRDVRDVASKAADNVARLAALFQVFEHGDGAVDVEAINAAGRIVAWHLSESRRFFGELVLPPELLNAAKLDGWLVEYCRREGVTSVSTRDVQQFGPGGLRDKVSIEVAARELEAVERARLVQDGKRKLIEVNPALLL